jgi:hypothetical protein
MIPGRLVRAAHFRTQRLVDILYTGTGSCRIVRMLASLALNQNILSLAQGDIQLSCEKCNLFRSSLPLGQQQELIAIPRQYQCYPFVPIPDHKPAAAVTLN